jgi:hypothetical protein
MTPLRGDTVKPISRERQVLPVTMRHDPEGGHGDADSQGVEPLAWRAKDAARAIGVSARTLFTWTKSGVIPSAHVNGITIYPVDALRSWLASCTRTATKGGDS